MTRPSTFESVQRWKADLDSKVFLPNGDHIPAVLLANKVLLQHMCVQKEEEKCSLMLYLSAL